MFSSSAFAQGNKRLGIESGSATGSYVSDKKAAGTYQSTWPKSQPLTGSASGVHFQYRTTFGITWGVQWSSFDLSGSNTSDGTTTSDGTPVTGTTTTHYYTQEIVSGTLGIELGGIGALRNLTLNPRVLFPIAPLSKFSYQYKKTGTETRDSDIISDSNNGVTLIGYEFPILYDLPDFYIGVKVFSYSKSGPIIQYKTGGSAELKVENGLNMTVGWSFGKGGSGAEYESGGAF